MGKSFLEPRITEEINRYIDTFIIPYLGKPIDLSESMMMATANIISQMVIGRRSEYDDPEFLAWMNAFDDSIKASVKAAISRNIPFSKYLPGDLGGELCRL